MNKIILAIMLMINLYADPYIGIGGSFSNAKNNVKCRASGVLIAGHEVNEWVAGEIRYSNGFNNDYNTLDFMIKPQYKNVYLLAGYGKTNYKEQDSFSGGRYGAGVKLADFFGDVIYRAGERDTAITFGYVYRF